MAHGLKPGVHCISATPFLPDESLDPASLKTLLDYLAAGGCTGALVLGVLGEADRLDDDSVAKCSRRRWTMPATGYRFRWG